MSRNIRKKCRFYNFFLKFRLIICIPPTSIKHQHKHSSCSSLLTFSSRALARTSLQTLSLVPSLGLFKMWKHNFRMKKSQKKRQKLHNLTLWRAPRRDVRIIKRDCKNNVPVFKTNSSAGAHILCTGIDFMILC